MSKQKDIQFLSGNPDAKGLKHNLLMGLLIFGIFWALSYAGSVWFIANGTPTERGTATFYKDILSSMGLFLAIFTVIRVLKPHLPIDFILHNPENSMINRILGQKVLNTKRLFLISIAWGIIMSVLIYTTGFTIISMPVEYAADPVIGKVRSAFLKANPTSPAENVLIFGFLLGLVYLVLHRLIRIPWSIALVLTILIIGIIIFPAYHWAKYGAAESDLMSTAIFGTTNAGISAMTGSLLFTEVWHQVNNYVGEMRQARTFGISVEWFS